VILRLAAATVALVLTAGVVTGCSDPAGPAEPTPTFTSEAEAFAAAEATYRAYVGALNQVDLSDPETFEDVYGWTTGDANANERETLSQMHADGWVVSGDTVIASFRGDDFAPSRDTVVLATVCSDVSGVSVTDSDGTSMVSADRPDVYALEISFVLAPGRDTGLTIAASNAVEDDTCTSP
jgi:hypothetical protein